MKNDTFAFTLIGLIMIIVPSVVKFDWIMHLTFILLGIWMVYEGVMCEVKEDEQDEEDREFLESIDKSLYE